MELKKIQLSIQQIVSALAAVLKIEVEVSDKNLFRVAGTGLLKNKIWKEMLGEDIVYRHCIETRKTIVIKNPGAQEICKACIHFGRCKEQGEICSPIIVNNEVVGVIGLIAFNETQRGRLFMEEEANIVFLEKIADVIATKLKEHTFFRQQLIAQKKITTIFDYVDHGVITLNEKGECEYINEVARKMWQLPSGQILNPQKIKLLRDTAKQQPTGQIVHIEVDQQVKKVYVKYHQLQLDTQDKTAVIILEDPDYIQSVANHLSQDVQKVELIGQTPAMEKLKQLILKISYGDMPVSLTGEAGTGKSFIAKSIHNTSVYAENNFEKVNCSFYSNEELERELFGYSEKGHYYEGRLQAANEGTLYIEEIENMPIAVQVRLLKFLMDGLVLQGTVYHKLKVRIIASSTSSLTDKIQLGQFRQDLYYKLNVVPMHIPSLRERREDIPHFVDYFLQRHKVNGIPKSLDDRVRQIFYTYHWPGNIQEVANVVAYACNVEPSTTITESSLPDFIVQETKAHLERREEEFDLRRIEKRTIRLALDEVKRKNLRKEDAALLLGLSRATLFRKINEYQL